MKKIVLSSIAGAALMASMVSGVFASGSGAQKVPLRHFARALCQSDAIGPVGQGSGFAVIHENGTGTLIAEVSLKDGLPNTTYHVRLIETPAPLGCYVFDGTLTTNAEGKGNAHIEEPAGTGAIDAYVDLSSQGIAGDYYSTPDVVFSS